MEGVIRRAQFREEFECRVGFHMGSFYGVAGLLPRPVKRALPEHVHPRPYERMPVTDGQAQVILHALAEHQLVTVVMAVGERIVGLRAFITYGRQMFEI